MLLFPLSYSNYAIWLGDKGYCRALDIQVQFTVEDSMFARNILFTLLAVSIAGFAQEFPDTGVDPSDTGFQVRYAANLGLGESYINIVNTGANGAPLLGPGLGAATGNICVNVYAFDPGEELVA